ncbi:MAG: intradiol ring-cleavage dioxygenase [Geminicoccaceae bacterium]
MAQFSEHDLTDAVIERLAECDDPRFKTVMSSLIRHLHAFVRDVELTEREWITAIRFLTEVGQACTDKRQEFILLSDTLGVSILVDAINHRLPTGAVESTVLGPWYLEGAPELPLGADISNGVAGEPTFYSGRLMTLGGEPIAGGLLDVWSGDGAGLYDMQMPGQTAMLCRGKFRTDAEGRYWFRSIRPTYYPVPTDGPVGKMLRKMGRHPNRPGHIHMIVSAPGHETVTTHLFVAGAPYLDSDAVFAVKDSLIVDFERHEPGAAPTGEVMDVPFYTAEYDFRLAPANG